MNQTDACNAALGRIGSFTIASIDENSSEARQCKRHFDRIRQSLLRDFDFNFSVAWQVLSQISGGAAFDYDYAYQLPSDYLRIISFDGVRAGTRQNMWKIANSRLYTDDSSSDNAKLEYVRDVTDVTEWDSTFGEAFSWYLAAAIAPAITSDPKLALGLLQAGQAFLSDAKGADTQEDGLKVMRGLEYSQCQRAREGYASGLAGGYQGAPWMYQDFGPPGNA